MIKIQTFLWKLCSNISKIIKKKMLSVSSCLENKRLHSIRKRVIMLVSNWNIAKKVVK
jgi:hypothetical protein